ncbi:MAG: anti-sigma factor domain-containing protein [Bacillota bacterium]|nr:anti-sigma factor domain-containing protein [Bacillota bacterium]
MYKGIVIKIEKIYAIVLTDKEQYLRLSIKEDMDIGNKIYFTELLYRPFDVRYSLFTGKSSGFIGRPRTDTYKHFLKENLGLIGFDEFLKVKMVVGEIIDVKNHPNADKLYLLKIDLKTEVRQVVAGLKKFYTKEELLNKKIVMVANLKPAKLRGEVSEGMLLAAESDKNTVKLLTVDIENGATIR